MIIYDGLFKIFVEKPTTWVQVMRGKEKKKWGKIGLIVRQSVIFFQNYLYIYFYKLFFIHKYYRRIIYRLEKLFKYNKKRPKDSYLGNLLY